MLAFIPTHSWQKLSQGLDDVHPFSYTEGVDKVIRDAEKILSPDSASVSSKNASRIWAFMSKFVMLDRFVITFGVAEVYGGKSVPKQTLTREDVAGASQVWILLLNHYGFLTRFLSF